MHKAEPYATGSNCSKEACLLKDTVTAEAIGTAGIFDGRAIETSIRDHMGEANCG